MNAVLFPHPLAEPLFYIVLVALLLTCVVVLRPPR